MKRVTLILFIFLCNNIFGKGKLQDIIKEGDILFSERKFTAAINKYKKGLLTKKSNNKDILYRRIYESYFMIDDLKNAKIYVSKITNMAIKDNMAYNFLKKKYPFIIKKKDLNKEFPLPRNNINLEKEKLVFWEKKKYYNDLLLSRYKENIFITSNQSKNVGFNYIDANTGMPFYNIYYFNDGVKIDLSSRNNKINKYGVSFYIYKNTLYSIVVASSHKKIKGLYIPTLYLYKYDNYPEEWNIYNGMLNWSPIKENIFNDKYIYSKVTIYDDKYMVLSRKGRNEENYSLYLSLLKEGKWSHPKKIKGVNIDNFNTGFPSFDDRGSLYFNSDRPGGYGGYDLYKIDNFIKKYNRKKYMPVTLLPSPINSNENDYSIEMINNNFLFTSNRNNMFKLSHVIKKYNLENNNLSSTDSNISLSRLFKISANNSIHIDLQIKDKFISNYDMVIYGENGLPVYKERTNKKYTIINNLVVGTYRVVIFYGGRIYKYVSILGTDPEFIKVKIESFPEVFVTKKGEKISLEDNRERKNININATIKKDTVKELVFKSDSTIYIKKKISPTPEVETSKKNQSIKNTPNEVNLNTLTEIIFFKENTAFMPTAYRYLLDNIVHILKSKHSKSIINIYGFREKNELSHISLKRAKEVYYYLISRGIDKNLIKYESKGFSSEHMLNSKSNKLVKIKVNLVD